MTNEEINRAVAESAGLTCMTTECEECDGCGELGGEADAYNCPNCEGTGVCSPRYIGADYCNSCDAVLPLVRALKKGRQDWFVEKLERLVLPMSPTSQGGVWRADKWECHALITATPRQLCEAYLAVGGVDA